VGEVACDSLKPQTRWSGPMWSARTAAMTQSRRCPSALIRRTTGHFIRRVGGEQCLDLRQLRRPAPQLYSAQPQGNARRISRRHANIATTRTYDHRKTRPEDSPTFKMNY
jgi:hypothetical protein